MRLVLGCSASHKNSGQGFHLAEAVCGDCMHSGGAGGRRDLSCLCAVEGCVVEEHDDRGAAAQSGDSCSGRPRGESWQA